jgi:hypothetical protein
MTRARTLADMISDGVIGTTELADDAITPVKLDETGNYTIAQLDVNGTVTAGDITLSSGSPIINITDTDTGVDHQINASSGIGNLAINVDPNNEGSNAGLIFRVGGSGTANQYFRMAANGDTRFYDSSANTLLFIDESVGVAINDDGADKDFRVESDGNSNMLFVDAANNRVAIGTNDTTSSGSLIVAGSAIVGRTSTTTGDFFSSGGGNSGTYNGIAIMSNSDAINAQSNTSLSSWIVDVGGRAGDGITFPVTTQDSFSVRRVAAGGTYYGAANYLQIDAGEAVFNQDGLGQDFRVKSQNFDDMLFVDASENAVGIGSGTTLPTTTATWRHLFIGGNLAFMSNTTVNEDVYMFSNMYYNNDFKVRNDGKVAYLRMDDGIFYFAGSSATQTAGASASYNNFLTINPSNEAVFNQDGLNHDFRVESDAYSHMIFVDASENRVSIGHNSTAGYGSGHVLSVAGGSTQFSNFGNDVTMMIRGGNYTDPNTASVLLSGGYGDNGYVKEWLVSSVASGGGGAIQNDLKFRYVAGGSATQYEALKLRHNGEVIVNEEGWGTHDFRVESDTNDNMLFVDASLNSVVVGGNSYTDCDLVVLNANQGARGNLRVGYNRQRAFTVSLHGSESRWFKLIGYTGGSMWNGRCLITTNRNGGYNQSGAYREYKAAIGGYANNIYGPLNATGDTGEGGSASLMIGTDESLYLQCNPNIYGGTVHVYLEGDFGNWQFDGTYVTTSP